MRRQVARREFPHHFRHLFAQVPGIALPLKLTQMQFRQAHQLGKYISWARGERRKVTVDYRLVRIPASLAVLHVLADGEQAAQLIRRRSVFRIEAHEFSPFLKSRVAIDPGLHRSEEHTPELQSP